MRKETTAIIAVMALVTTMFGWGVAFERTTIDMYQGNSYHYYTEIQNMENHAKNISISLSGDSIAEIEGQKYYIMQPETRNPVYIKITVPQKATKDTYTVRVIYTAIPVGLGLSIATQKVITITIHVVDYGQIYSPTSGSGGGSSGTSGTIANTTNHTMTENNESSVAIVQNDDNKTILQEEEVQITNAGVGVTVTDPLMTYISIIVIVGIIASVGIFMWKKGVVDEVRDLAGL